MNECDHPHIDVLQHEINEWSTRNFGDPVVIKYNISSFLGIVEEVGEIAHSILKLSQGIRGTRVEHEAAIVDGIADLLVFTLDFAARNGIDAERALETVWAKVKRRDFTQDKAIGGKLGHCSRCARGRLIDPVTGECAECRKERANAEA